MLSKRSTSPRGRQLKVKGKLRYSSKKYNNPFFGERKSKKKRVGPHLSYRFKIAIYATGILLLLLVAYALYGPYFKISHINIDGQGRIDPKIINDLAWTEVNNSFIVVYPKNNILLFNSSKLYKNLAKKYAFNELRIERRFPNTINIFYQEKAYAAIYSENEEFYYIDSSGMIISDANLMEISERDYPIIANSGESKINNEQAPIDSDAVEIIINIFKKFKDLSADFKIERFLIGEELNTIKIKLHKGPILIFNSKNDIQKQIDKLKIIKSEKLEGTFDTKEYIDLRFGSSVYYR